MALKTPPLHAKGVYQVELPWTIAADTIYECIAIRDFNDYMEAGQSVFDLFYAPKGLVLADYQTDKALGANIITLDSPTHPTIHIPDTYITAYPDLGHVAYKNVVLSISLGAIPDGLSLLFLKDQIQGAVSDVIGVISADVKEHVAPFTGVITPDQHAALETAREAAIVNRTTDRAKVIALTAEKILLQEKIAALEQIVLDAGLVTP